LATLPLSRCRSYAVRRVIGSWLASDDRGNLTTNSSARDAVIRSAFFGAGPPRKEIRVHSSPCGVRGRLAAVASLSHCRAHMDGRSGRSQSLTGKTVDMETSSRRLCPFCFSDHLRLSKFRLTDIGPLLALHYPLRCRDCRERVYAFIWQAWVCGLRATGPIKKHQ